MMSRIKSVFTAEVMNEVRILLAKHKTTAEIALVLECDIDSLRTACNRAGIQLRQNRDEVSIRISMTPDICDLLRKEARIRGRSSSELAAEIIDAVCGDQIFSAVLDK